jgi:hypothetical protein
MIICPQCRSADEGLEKILNVEIQNLISSLNSIKKGFGMEKQIHCGDI